MEGQAVSWFESLLTKFGWPGAMLIVLVVFGIYIVRSLANWGGPLITEFISAHTSLARKLESNLEEQQVGHFTTHQKVEAVHADVKEIKQKLK